MYIRFFSDKVPPGCFKIGEQYGKMVSVSGTGWCRERATPYLSEIACSMKYLSTSWLDVDNTRTDNTRRDNYPNLQERNNATTWASAVFNLFAAMLRITWDNDQEEGVAFHKHLYGSRLMRLGAIGRDVRIPGIPYRTRTYFEKRPPRKGDSKFMYPMGEEWGERHIHGIGGVVGIPAEWAASIPVMSCLIYFARVASSLRQSDLDPYRLRQWFEPTSWVKQTFGNSDSASLFVFRVGTTLQLSKNGSVGLWFLLKLLYDGLLQPKVRAHTKELLFHLPSERRNLNGVNSWLYSLMDDDVIKGDTYRELAFELYNKGLRKFYNIKPILY